jgi:methyl-accepting chemotaxis protein/carbonic anhydrase
MKPKYTLATLVSLFAAAAFAANTSPNISSDEALARLKEGNSRYVAGKPIHPNQDAARRAVVAKGQTPFATVLSCADSRVPVELLFDQGIGDTFVVRVAGNVSDIDEIGTMEYGVGHLNTPLLVVLGHSNCGAVKAVLEGAQVHGSIPALVDNIAPAVVQAKAGHPGAGIVALLGEAVKTNVWISIDDLFKHSAEVRDLVKGGKLKVVGAIYSLESGEVSWLGAHPEQARLLAYSGGAGHDAPAASSAADAHGAAGSAHATPAPGHGSPAAPVAGASGSHAATNTKAQSGGSTSGGNLGVVVFGLGVAAVLLALAGGTFYATRRSSFRTRILASSVLLLVFMLGASGYAWYEFQQIGHELNAIAEDDLPILSNLADVEAEILQQALAIEKFASSGAVSHATEFDRVGAEVEHELKTVKTELEHALKGAVDDEDRRRLQKTMGGLSTLAKEHQDFDQKGDEFIVALRAGRKQQAAQLKVALDREGHELHTVTTALLDEVQASTRHQAEMAQKAKAEGQMLLLLVSLASIVIGIGFALFTARDVSRGLGAVAGNLSAGAEQTAAAAGQVAASSQSLAEGSSEQAASLEETSSSLEEMSSMTKRNAENAHKANDLARDARRAADAGVADMQAMATAMNDIKVSSDDIGKIIKTIDEIAFQTNILALNAAVEAARAGEAGMGFAVVADEVRNLAQRSAVAAKETAGKIEGAITRTALGVQLTDKVAKVLQEIVTKARQVDELVAEVANASKEQTQSIEQLNVAIGQIDKVTQSNAANAEESASAAEEMSAQTEALKEAVAELLALVNGSDGGQRTVVTGGAGKGAHSLSGAPAKRSLRAAAGGRSNGTPRNGAASEHTIVKPVALTASNRGAAPSVDMFKDISG